MRHFAGRLFEQQALFRLLDVDESLGLDQVIHRGLGALLLRGYPER
jgi:hypothetical protein